MSLSYFDSTPLKLLASPTSTVGQLAVLAAWLCIGKIEKYAEKTKMTKAQGGGEFVPARDRRVSNTLLGEERGRRARGVLMMRRVRLLACLTAHLWKTRVRNLRGLSYGNEYERRRRRSLCITWKAFCWLMK